MKKEGEKRLARIFRNLLPAPARFDEFGRVYLLAAPHASDWQEVKALQQELESKAKAAI